MLCPDCGKRTKVVHTSNNYIVERIHYCQNKDCGISFHTQEKITSLTSSTAQQKKQKKSETI